MREAKNTVYIEGILSEIDLKYGSYNRDGAPIDTIGGSIKIRVDTVINGEERHCEIPVHMFATKYSRKGTLNSAYESIEKVMKEYVSIAAAGGIEGADKIRVSGAKIAMNEYYGQNGKLVSFPRIQGSFVNRVTGELKPEARFQTEIVVESMQFATDADGVEIEPKRLEVRGILPQYGDKVDVVKFVATNPNVISAIESSWEAENTYSLIGRLNFTSTTEHIKEEQDFGEAIERERTITISDLVITGGSDSCANGDMAYDINEIAAALKERKARLEELKAKAALGGKAKAAPVAQKGGKLSAEDLGF